MTRWVWTYGEDAPHPMPASEIDLLQWEVVACTEADAWAKIRDACADLLDVAPQAAEMMARAAWHVAVLTGGDGTPCSEAGCD